MNEAIDKIRDEMAAKPDNATIQRIGEYMTDYVRSHPSAAVKISADGKTIAGALKALEEYARKQPRSGNCAMVDDETAFGVVLTYYGIKKDSTAAPARSLDAALDLDSLLNI